MRGITCGCFERQAADWLSRRLSPERASEMAAHQQVCASCTQVAHAEARLRERWREELPSPVAADLWPRLASRLEARRPSDAWFDLRRPRWSVAALAALTALSVCYWVRPLSDQPGSGRAATVSQGLPLPSPAVSQSRAELQSQADAWATLGSVSQEDPAVDDPVGANMESVWICLKTDSK